MKMMRLIVLFGAFLLAIHAFEYGCTFTSPSKDYYDLSPLSKCDGSGYSTNTADGGFSINICNEVQGCGGSSAVCQDNYYNAGKASTAALSAYNGPEKGVVLTYTQGDGGGCPSGQRKTVLTFVCSTNAEPVFSFVSENPQCTYNFNVKTSVACPTQAAPQKEMCMLNVFLVPHTHDDVGWLLTIDGYYETEVKNILDTAVAALVANPKRKFIYVEQAYFTRWWYDSKTSDSQRQDLKRLYDNGQWEFVIGGWVMQDEACTTYGADVDQMTLGHQFLYNTFGAKPTKGWQIDPFGASSVTPYLEKLSGFDAHCIDRVTNKDVYNNNQRLDFIWQGLPGTGEKGQLFTEILGGGGYCDFDGPFNFQNDPVNSGNVANYANQFVQMVNGRAPWYKTRNILAEWGCDFAFQNATAMFHSMDQVVEYLQKNVNTTRINIQYTTLSEYYDAVWEDAKTQNIQWPVNQGGDFFPYLASLWWTGYYTSRVELKGYVRRGEAAAHGAEQLLSFGKAIKSFDNKKAYDDLYKLRVANGDAQHHDGVTGTSVPEVVLMYQNDLIDGMKSALGAGANILNSLVAKNQNTPATLVSGTDAVLNLKTGQTAVVVLYNSLGWAQTQTVVLPVNATTLLVQDSNLDTVTSQITPAHGGNITSKYHLFFVATVQPAGYTTYYVSLPASKSEGVSEFVAHEPVDKAQDTVLKNSFLQVTISATTGRISQIINLKDNINLPVDQNINEYVSLHSGAYAFGPAGPSYPLSSSVPQTTVATGSVVSEVYQVFTNSETAQSYAKQTIRLYNAGGDASAESFLEILFDLGPLPSHREVVSIFTTPIKSQSLLVSDDNGFTFLEREYQWGTGIESNYYPMVYASYITDYNSQLTLISERSHGASSQKDGQIEVMMHRNPDMGDGFGPGLTDTTEVYPSLRVLLNTPQGSPEFVHKHSYLMNFPFTVYSANTNSASAWRQNNVETDQFFAAELPANVHFLSMNALNDNTKTAIFRLAHVFAADEDSPLAAPATVDVKKLLSRFNIQSFQEVTLTANTNMGTVSTTVVLNPQDIRTFLVTFA